MESPQRFFSSQERLIKAYYAAISEGLIVEVPNNFKCDKCPRPHKPFYHLCAPCHLVSDNAPAAPISESILRAEAQSLL